MSDERHGAKQPRRFDPARAAILDDPARFTDVAPDTLLAALDIPPSGTLLDFGAGTGLYALELARRRPDVHVVALDEQPAMLDHVRAAIARGGSGTIVAFGPEQLEAWRGRVDRVLALNVLHELGDAALRDLRALLVPQGSVLFVDWNADVERPIGPPRDHVYGIDEAAQRLAAAGFTVVDRTTLRYHYALRGIPSSP